MKQQTATPSKVHSVDYIRAIKDYLRLRTISDNIQHNTAVHLSYLAFNVRANGTSSVGYNELRKLRIGRTTLSNDNKKFIKSGIVSKIDIGHANQFGKGGKTNVYHFDLPTILWLNKESAESQQTGLSKNEKLAGPESNAESQRVSAESLNQSAESQKGVEPVPPMGTHPDKACPETACPEKASPDQHDENCREDCRDVGEDIFERGRKVGLDVLDTTFQEPCDGDGRTCPNFAVPGDRFCEAHGGTL